MHKFIHLNLDQPLGHQGRVGRVGLELPYHCKSNEAPLSLPYKFEKEKWVKESLEEEGGGG
jgi:hypothetical protein